MTHEGWYLYTNLSHPQGGEHLRKNGTKSSIQGGGDGRGKRQSWDSRIIVIPAYTLIAHHLLTMLYSKRCLFLLSISRSQKHEPFPPLYPFLDPEFNISCCVWGEVSF